MKISLLNSDGTTMFDMFHHGDIEIHDILSGDKFIFNISKSTVLTINGNEVYRNDFKDLECNDE